MSNTLQKKVAAIYIRKSREDRDKPSQRLTYQREQLPAHAEKEGWKYVIYDDGHASASIDKIENLQARAQLARDIRAGKIHVILVIEISRLSRDVSLQDYVVWLSLCANHGVKVATPSRMLDPAQNSDWMLLLMEGGFSSVEMRQTLDRMAEGRKQAFTEGKFLGGTPPKPYVYNHKMMKPIIDGNLLIEIEQLWSLAEKMSAKAVAREMDLPEIAVRRAISDERLLFYQALRINPDNGEHIKCEWEAVMNSERAARIQDARRTRRNFKDRRNAAGLLSNLALVFCGYCQRTVKTWQNSKTRLDGTRLDYYGCQTKNERGACVSSRLIPKPELDSRVLKNLFNTLESLEDLKSHWLEEQGRKDPGEELRNLAKSEKKRQEEKKRLVAAIRDGIADFDDVRRDMVEIKESLEKIERRKSEILASKEEPPDWDALNFTMVDFERLDFDDQRRFLKAAIHRIDLYENYAIITYPFPRRSDGARTSRVHLPQSKRRSHKENQKRNERRRNGKKD